jgi:hypothetical protein
MDQAPWHQRRVIVASCRQYASIELPVIIIYFAIADNSLSLLPCQVVYCDFWPCILRKELSMLSNFALSLYYLHTDAATPTWGRTFLPALVDSFRHGDDVLSRDVHFARRDCSRDTGIYLHWWTLWRYATRSTKTAFSKELALPCLNLNSSLPDSAYAMVWLAYLLCVLYVALWTSMCQIRRAKMPRTWTSVRSDFYVTVAMLVDIL